MKLFLFFLTFFLVGCFSEDIEIVKTEPIVPEPVIEKLSANFIFDTNGDTIYIGENTFGLYGELGTVAFQFKQCQTFLTQDLVKTPLISIDSMENPQENTHYYNVTITSLLNGKYICELLVYNDGNLFESKEILLAYE